MAFAGEKLFLYSNSLVSRSFVISFVPFVYPIYLLAKETGQILKRPTTHLPILIDDELDGQVDDASEVGTEGHVWPLPGKDYFCIQIP